MRRLLPVLIFTILCTHLNAQVGPRPQVIKGQRTAITGSLRQWKPDRNDPRLRIKMRDEKGLIFARDLEPLTFTHYGSRYSGPDPLWQRGQGRIDIPANSAITATQPMVMEQVSAFSHDQSEIDLNVEGIPISNVTPGDPTLAVGPNHVIEMVNGQNGSALFRIYDRNGQTLGLQAFMDQLPGSSYSGAGDCITWYDQLTDRFVMSEFGDSSETGTNVNTLIIAVSQTADPLGSWYIYEFSDDSFFPDYPKYGNWNDAWYGMTRDFEGSYVGNSVWAFNKAKMIAGDPVAEVQRFRFTSPDNKFNSMCPVSLSGPNPAPAGTPGLFLYYSDDNFTSAEDDVDSVGVISFKVDFADPANSVARIEASLPVAPFRSIVCASRSCAPSPSGNGYDVIASRFMNRPYYRNFGSYQAIVGNHTVDATGNAVSGVRWYEIRHSASNWSVHQQGTFAPQEDYACSTEPEMHRFMGTVAMNARGQIALAYNSSSAQRFASLSFTGRNQNDPPNIMSYTEKDAFIGTGYGTFGNRWGDYNELLVDVLDDSLFWFCGMYGGGSNTWRTRILSFKLKPNPNLDASITRIEYPNNCENFCSQVVRPRLRIRNLGNQTLTRATVFFQVNNGPISSAPWTGSLSIAQETLFTFLPITLPTGNSQLKAWIKSPNGGTDQNIFNDTSLLSISVGSAAAIPLTEGFESATFPPTGWTQFSSGSSTFRWERSTQASRSGAASVRFDNYNNNEPGKYADLRSPLLDARNSDSLSLQFWMAAALFDPVTSDTLEILASTDCGASFQRVWQKFGADLATRPGSNNGEYIPTPNEWRQESVDLSDFAGAEKLIISFRNINNFGNNIYIDDIQINKGSFLNLDAAVLSITKPLPVVCENTIEPEISFVNLGKDTLRSLRIEYVLDDGTRASTNWNGSLARLEGSVVTMPSTSSGTGNRLLTVVVSEPNGQADELAANDSGFLAFGVKRELPLPVREGFEQGSFPPADWNLVNSDRGKGWENTRTAARNGVGSMFMNNFDYQAGGQRDELISPLMRYENVDSVYIYFQLAASTRVFPGSTDVPLDTLEILVSTDCGNSYTTVYKKWGSELQTLGKPNDPNPQSFTPANAGQWRKEEINLTQLLGTSNRFLVSFRNTSQGDNNIFIDDVEFVTKNLPARLKDNGFLVSPNPFRNQFLLQFYPNASDLRNIDIYNNLGQKVYTKQYASGSASSGISVDLSRQAAGIYTVRIQFEDRVEIQRVVKQ